MRGRIKVGKAEERMTYSFILELYKGKSPWLAFGRTSLVEQVVEGGDRPVLPEEREQRVPEPPLEPPQ